MIIYDCGCQYLLQHALVCESSSSHGGEYKVQICLLGCTAMQNNCRPTFQRYVLPPSLIA
jgi:hypothetical protein